MKNLLDERWCFGMGGQINIQYGIYSVLVIYGVCLKSTGFDEVRSRYVMSEQVSSIYRGDGGGSVLSFIRAQIGFGP